MSPEEANSQLAELRPTIASGKSSLLGKFKARIAAVENLRLAGVIGGVAGALVAALSRSIEGDVGLGLAIGGAVLAAVCGAVVGLMDRKKLEISQEASDAFERADKAIEIASSLANSFASTQSAVEAFDKKRRERLTALGRMIEIAEASLITRTSNVELAAQTMLRSGIHSIRSAVEYAGEDFFTVTIFRRVTINGSELMQRIAAEWTNPQLAAEGGRSWTLGRGYTGVAWQNALTNPNGDVVIGDTADDTIKTQYPVDSFDPAREELYRSVAAIPILIKDGNEVWGVVTATTSRPNVFVRDRENIKVQNVDMIRDVAKVAALLAGLQEA